MPFETITPNMGLIEPGVGLTAGPQYASDLNASLTIIDGHNHAPGSGVQITPAGIDINTDLTFNSNGMTAVKSLQFASNSSPLSILGSIYESGVDLYYNDGNGNQIQITSAGSVNAGAGSITGLTSPASATYVSGSQTFVWQSGVNIAANMDMGSAVLRKLTTSSAGITISPPSSLASNYTITLPSSVPAANNTFLTMSTSGVISDSITVDGSTIQIVSNQLTANIGAGSITGSQIASHTVTESNLELRPTSSSATAGQIALSTSCGTFSTASTTFVDVTNLSVSLVTTGRPVRVMIQSDATTTPCRFNNNNTSGVTTTYQLLRGATLIGTYEILGTSGVVEIPAMLEVLDTPTAGTYTYKLQAKVNVNTNTGGLVAAVLVAYEI